MSEKHVIRSKVDSQLLSFGETDVCDAIQHSELVDCTLRIERPSAFAMCCSRFTRCRFEVAKQAREENWQTCEFTDCVFSGRFYSCTFGGNVDPLSPCEIAVKAGLTNCDFSCCDMHLCSFYNCDPETLVLPGWPQITVIHPIQNAEDWMKIPFPKSFWPFQDTVAYNGDTKIVSVVNWETYARKHGEPKQPSPELRKILESKSYIRM
jgi:hypothetical protein